MDGASALLLALIRKALWNTPPAFAEGYVSPLIWESVYALARRQTVQGIVFEAVKDMPQGTGPDILLSAKWLLDVEQIARNDAHIDDVTGKLAEVWKRLGIDAVHLKGMRIAAMYPVPERRVCGDIDWYFRTADDRMAANDWAEREKLEPKKDSDGTVHYTCQGVVVEHHRLPFNPEDPMEIIVMTNLHILKHSIVKGIGLRQLCDLAVMYRHYAGAYDKASLRKDLESKKMLSWTDLLHRVLIRYIGLPEEFLPWPLEKDPSVAADDRDADRYMEQVLMDGDFGRSNDHVGSGIFKRVSLLFAYAPERIMRRWLGLVFGRLFKRNKKA